LGWPSTPSLARERDDVGWASVLSPDSTGPALSIPHLSGDVRSGQHNMGICSVFYGNHALDPRSQKFPSKVASSNLAAPIEIAGHCEPWVRFLGSEVRGRRVDPAESLRRRRNRSTLSSLHADQFGGAVPRGGGPRFLPFTEVPSLLSGPRGTPRRGALLGRASDRDRSVPETRELNLSPRGR
jgi:hypothetical protein